MKRFVFHLESVLQLRAGKEREVQEAHAAAGRRVEECVEELAYAENEWRLVVVRLEEQQRSPFRRAERDLLWQASEYHKQQCRQIGVKLEELRKELEARRVALLEARRDHEAMLKMKAKQKQEHDLMMERDEHARMDDMINARHAAKRPGKPEAVL